jgi:hypothetical protein
LIGKVADLEHCFLIREEDGRERSELSRTVGSLRGSKEEENVMQHCLFGIEWVLTRTFSGRRVCDCARPYLRNLATEYLNSSERGIQRRSKKGNEKQKEAERTT